MPDPLWLPDVLRAEGLEVQEYSGWRNRGHGDFGAIWGVIAHHTGASGSPGPGVIAHHPQLGLASQLHLSRSGVYTVCGAGIAWHAGAGAWPGIARDNANAVTIGIEAENNGTEGWSDAQYSAYVKGVAAILRHLGHDSSRVIGHKEWAGPSQGKWDPGSMDMDAFRRDVQAAIDRKPTTSQGGSGMSWGDQILNLDGDKVSREDMLRYIDLHVGQVLDQLGGLGTRRGADFPGWPQLGGRTVVDALAAIGAELGIDGFTDPKAGK
ncbi:N-acetylmuramoyl-L-alanine amidase [Nocardia cyriacigeorgica]|uniref:N-acetylmuramoyl-L-alanine amidase n=1 Tax=Nocardia cyriacigeorgica TaxID=135487 RepID=UPI00158EE603|nr:N-acetylmuramoyl-L-alanine amidase [Nocardia cyriacigeorgica]